MINDIIKIAENAGNIIMQFYNRDYNVHYKKDTSPVTEADIAANNYIINELKSKFSHPILSEESTVVYNKRKEWSKFWLVDPLDGTKDFINNNGNFTVNIALINNQRPVLGVVNSPAPNDIYWAEKGKGAYKNGKVICTNLERVNLIGTCSNFHSSDNTKDFFIKNKINKINKYGSSLKFCKLAEGEVDIYPRLTGSSEWDIAAAEIILQEAGGNIVSYPDKKTLIYNKKNIRNPFFIASRNGLYWE